MNENSSTKGYHYESHSTEYQDEQGNVYYTSSVKIRELDEGEVGILLAGNNSIFDPTLTPRMLAVPSDYDISDIDKEEEDNEEDGDEDDEDDEDESSIEEKWFPSLLRHSWIYGLDNDDEQEDWIKKIKDIISSSEIIEKENDDHHNNGHHDLEHHHKRKRSKKSKHHDHDDDFTYSTFTTTLVPVDITYILLND
ncbi:unnamed protein product [Cunninghamella blakesleeana]